MAANIYQKTLTLTTDWQALSATALVLDATLMVPQSNYGDVAVRINADDSTLAYWPAGAPVAMRNVDLSRIQVKGTAGDKFTVVAQS